MDLTSLGILTMFLIPIISISSLLSLSALSSLILKAVFVFWMESIKSLARHQKLLNSVVALYYKPHNLFILTSVILRTLSHSSMSFARFSISNVKTLSSVIFRKGKDSASFSNEFITNTEEAVK